MFELRVLGPSALGELILPLPKDEGERVKSVVPFAADGQGGVEGGELLLRSIPLSRTDRLLAPKALKIHRCRPMLRG